MTNYDLVMQLVLDHDDAMKNLTFEQTKNVILTTKTAMDSRNVLCMHKKYGAVSIYNAIYNYIMEIGYATYYSNNNRDRSYIHQLERETDNYIVYIRGVLDEDPELKDCLAKLINADYRDALYNKFHNLVTCDFELLLYDLCVEIYVNKLGICDVENYKHDPTHYMFIDGYPYDFYDKLENDGKSDIYKMYHSWKAQ